MLARFRRVLLSQCLTIGAPDQEKFYRGREYNRKKKTKAEAGSLGGTSNRQNDGGLNTAKILAEKHGISPHAGFNGRYFRLRQGGQLLRQA